MAKQKAKRCDHCGGAMWLDGDTVKCIMCSRPAKSEDIDYNTAARFGQPKLPVKRGWSRYE